VKVYSIYDHNHDEVIGIARSFDIALEFTRKQSGEIYTEGTEEVYEDWTSRVIHTSEDGTETADYSIEEFELL
jgi:hypothetical protein